MMSPTKTQTEPPIDLAALQMRAWDAFVAALPELLELHRDEWVAFRGAEQLLLASTQTQAYQEAAKKGYGEDELLVMCIRPDATDTPSDLDLYHADSNPSE